MIKKLCESQDIEKKVSVAFDLVVPVTMTESDVQDLIIEALSDKDVEVSSYMEVHDSELTESVSNLKRYDIDSMDSLIVSGLPQKFSNVRDGGSGNSNSYKIIGTPDEIKGVLAYCKSKGVKPRSTKVTPKDIKWYNSRLAQPVNESSDYSNDELNLLIKKAIRGDDKAIFDLKRLGYKITRKINPLKSVEVGTYVVSKGNKSIEHCNVFGSEMLGDTIIDNPAKYLNESVKLSGNFKKDVADIIEAIDSLQVPTEEGSYKYVLSEFNKIKKAVDSWIKDIRY